MGENENVALKQIQKEAQESSQTSIPKKSKEVYDREYSNNSSLTTLIDLQQSGLVVGWSSPVLSRLQSADSWLPITSAQGAWLASCVTLCSAFMTPFAAASLYYLGRRRTVTLAAVPFLVSWVLLAVAKSWWVLLAARLIVGIGTCLTFTSIPVYLAEISPDNIRGAIGVSMTISNNIGIIFMYYIGTFRDFWLISLLAAFPLLFFSFYKFLPESPYFLYENGKKDEAIEEFKRIRQQDNVDHDVKVMLEVMEEKKTGNSFVEIVKRTHHRRALFICLATQTIAQFTGGITLLLYAHLIFEKAGNVSADTMAMIKATIQLITSIFAAYVVDSIGKRPLLIVSCIGSSLFMFCLGIYFYLLDNNYNVDSIWWLPLVSMILFNISHTVGLQPISGAYLGELFHPNVKYMAVCIAKTHISINLFLISKFFQVITDAFGSCVPFFIFSVFGIVGMFFVIFYVPETKGRSFAEIQYYMKHKKYENDKL